MTIHLATVIGANGEEPVLRHLEHGVIRVRDLDPGYDGTALDIVSDGSFGRLREAALAADPSSFTDPDADTFTAPYRRPHKIWGIGLNYRDHAADLSESAPGQPASFVKCDHTVIGADEPIVVPPGIGRVTSEAELGLVIGRLCENVEEADALDYVWGVTTILDQTAEDILRQNPRYLTRSKNYRSFFSFGPDLVPLDEVLDNVGKLEDLEISTVRNGTEFRANTVAHMTHSPRALVSFHSKMMPLFPGDIISTGTPGALVVEDGDRMECRIPGVGTLFSDVRGGR